jgi:hypothetical protein
VDNRGVSFGIKGLPISVRGFLTPVRARPGAA